MSKKKITRKSLIAQIKGLTKLQCKQLGVDEPYPEEAPETGEEAASAIEAWLDGGVLTDEEGNALDLGGLFQEGEDTMTLNVHRASPPEDVAEEPIPIGAAVNGSPVDAVRGLVRKQIGGKKGSGAMPVISDGSHSLHKRTKCFESDEAQYRVGKWLGATIWGIPSAQKWCNENSMPWGKKSHIGSTDSLGGYTVPDLMADAVLWVRDLYGITPRIARHMTMDSDTLNVPKRSAGLTVYYPNQSSAITESTKEFGTEQLVAVKRAVLCAYSSEMGEDSIISIADDLSEEIGMALGLRLDTEMWAGDGTAAYGSVTGLRDGMGSAGQVVGSGDTWSDLELADFHKMVGALPEKHHPNAIWICSRAFFGSVIQKLVYAGGGNTVDTIQGGSAQQLFGYPIEMTDALPTATATGANNCVFGNFNNALLMGDKRAVEIQTSEHYSFNLDEITIRGTSRYDLSVVDGGTGAVIGAYVGLQTTG